jgi:hypothetical protein
VTLILVLATTKYGGYESKEAQEQALQEAITKSREDNPEHFSTLKETIIKNADPDKGYLTPSGTYVKIYKNPSSQERVYVQQGDKKYVPPAGTEIKPTSSEGKKIQERYAQQAQDRLSNMVQQERWYQITTGNASVRDTLMATQTPEQRALTEQYFKERNMSLDTPMNQLSLSPKKYVDAREASRRYNPNDLKQDPLSVEIRESYEKNKGKGFSPEYVKQLQEDRILGAGDLNRYVTDDINYTVPKDEVTKATPLESFDVAFARRQGELLAPRPVESPQVGGYYDIDTDPDTQWDIRENANLTEEQKSYIRQAVDSARENNFEYITIYQTRKNEDGTEITSVNTIPIAGKDGYDNFTEEYQRIIQFGKPTDTVEILSHVEEEPPAPEPTIEESVVESDPVKIPSYASHMVLGAIFAPNITKKFVDDISNALGIKIDKDADYRDKNFGLDGLIAPQENMVKMVGTLDESKSVEDAQKRISEIDYKDTGVDSVIRMYSAGIGATNPDEGLIADDVQKMLDPNYNYRKGQYDPIKGLGTIVNRIEEQRKIELEKWKEHPVWYTTTIISDSAQMAIVLPATLVANVAGKVGMISARIALSLKPSAVTTAGKIAEATRKITSGTIKGTSAVTLGGTYNNEQILRIPLKAILSSTEIERKAYPVIGDLYKTIKDTQMEYFDHARPSEIGEVTGTRVLDQLPENWGERVTEKMLDINIKTGIKVSDDLDPFIEATRREYFEAPTVQSRTSLPTASYYRDPTAGLSVGDNQLRFDIMKQKQKPVTAKPDTSEMNLGEVYYNEPLSSFSNLLDSPTYASAKRLQDTLPIGSRFESSTISFKDGRAYIPETILEVTQYQPRNRIIFNVRRGSEELIGDVRISKRKKADDIFNTTLYAPYYGDRYISSTKILTDEPEVIKTLGLIRPADYYGYNTPMHTLLSGLNKSGKLREGSIGDVYDSMDTRFDITRKINQYQILEEQIKFRTEKISNLEKRTDAKSAKQLIDEKEKLANAKYKLEQLTDDNVKEYTSILEYRDKKAEIDTIQNQINKLGRKKKDIERKNELKELQQQVKRELAEGDLEINARKGFLSIYGKYLDETFIHPSFRDIEKNEIENILNDPLFVNRLKMSSEQRTELAEFLASQRNKELSAEDFYHVERYVNTDEGRRILASSEIDNIIMSKTRKEIQENTNREFADSLVEYFKVKNQLVEAQITKSGNAEKLSEQLDQLIMETYIKEVVSKQERYGIGGYIMGRKLLPPENISGKIDEISTKKAKLETELNETQTTIDELNTLIKRETDAKKIYKDLSVDTADGYGNIKSGGAKIPIGQIEFHYRSYNIAEQTIDEIEKYWGGAPPKVGDVPYSPKNKLPPKKFDIEKIKSPTSPDEQTDWYKYVEENVSIDEMETDAMLHADPITDEVDMSGVKRYLEKVNTYDLNTKDLKKQFSGRELPKTSFDSVSEIDEMIDAVKVQLEYKSTRDESLEYYLKKLQSLKDDALSPQGGKPDKLGTSDPSPDTIAHVDPVREKKITDSIRYKRAQQIKKYSLRWLNRKLVGYQSTGTAGIDIAEMYMKDAFTDNPVRYSPKTPNESPFFAKTGRTVPIMTQGEHDFLDLLRMETRHIKEKTRLTQSISRLESKRNKLKREVESTYDHIKFSMASDKVFPFAVAVAKKELIKTYGKSSKNASIVNKLPSPENYKELESMIASAEKHSHSNAQLLKEMKYHINKKLEKTKEGIDDIDIQSKINEQTNDKETRTQIKYLKTEYQKIKDKQTVIKEIDSDIKHQRMKYDVHDNQLTSVQEEIHASPDTIKQKITLSPEEIAVEKIKLSSSYSAINKYKYNLEEYTKRKEKISSDLISLDLEYGILSKRLDKGEVSQVTDLGAKATMTLVRTINPNSEGVKKAISTLDNFQKIASGGEGAFGKNIRITHYKADRSYSELVTRYQDDTTIGTIEAKTQSSLVDDIKNIFRTKNQKGKAKLKEDQTATKIAVLLGEFDKSIGNTSSMIAGIRDGSVVDMYKRILYNEEISTKNVDKVLSNIDLLIEAGKRTGNSKEVKMFSSAKSRYIDIRKKILEAKSIHSDIVLNQSKTPKTKIENIQLERNILDAEQKLGNIVADIETHRTSILETAVPPEKQKVPYSKNQMKLWKSFKKDTTTDTTTDTVTPEGTILDNPKKDTKTVTNQEALLNRYLTQVSVTPYQKAYGALPIGAIPTVIRYPPSTPQEIIDNVIQQPEIDIPSEDIKIQSDVIAPQPDMKTFDNVISTSQKLYTDTRIDELMGQDIVPSTIQDTFRKYDTTKPPISDLKKLQIQKTQINTLQPQVFDYNYYTPSKQIPIHVPSVPPTSTVPKTPIVPVAPWFDVPFATRKKKKKEKKKKGTKKKIYWEVPDQPFTPYNPKEYYTFRTEPRAIKKKERSKKLD